MFMLSKKKVCFFAKVENQEYFSRVGFYKNDIQLLRELGYEVVTVNSIKKISLDADAYYVWWWTWAFIPVLIALIRRKPVIVTGVFDHYLNNEFVDFPKRNLLHRLLIRFSVKFATCNLFISELEGKMMVNKFRLKNYEVSKLSINHIFFSFKEYSSRKRLDTIFTISWLSKENVERKKLCEIIRAVPSVIKVFPHMKFVIAGKKHDGFPILEKLIDELNVSEYVHITGAISEAEKLDYLQNSAIYLQPTVVEGFGLAILEAMSCGTPVISSPVGTVPEVLGDTGIFIDHNDESGMSNAILKILSDPDMGMQMSIKAHQRSNLFNDRIREKEMQQILNKYL